ncbi:MAG: hypothetical protein GY746_13120 [Gammaproteobacteria bacterium]|nr:hypothetical protein [Gammaproteobacteria bacterium]MCP4277136.1 hypothetical protein [Gammaproteobacteria bacterium]
MKVTRRISQPEKVTKPAVKMSLQRLLRILLAIFAGFLVLMLVVVLSSPASLQRGIAALEMRWGDSLHSYDRSLADKLSIVTGSFLRTVDKDAPEIPELVIDVPFKEMRKIYAKREAALQHGNLIQGEDDFVKGEIRAEGRTIPIKLRLKGDWNDHLAGRKWSFRIHVRKGEQLFGMRKFSIQNPATRGYQSELMYFEVAEKFGLMSPRYSFVNVVLNGEPMGIMALEEFFGKELLEYNRRREGVIVRFDESLVWSATDSLTGETVGWGGAFDHYRNAAIDAIGSGKIAESAALTQQYGVAVGLLRGFVNKELTASEVFDAEQMGQFLAVSDAFGTWHAVAWHNLRFYLNPVTLKLEPIAFDATLQKRMKGGQSILNDEPMMLQVIGDPVILAAYRNALEELAGWIHSGELTDALLDFEAEQLHILNSEFRLLSNFPLDYMGPRIEILRQRFGSESQTLNNEFYEFSLAEQRVYPILSHVKIFDEGELLRLEISNAVPKDVEVLGIDWVNNETGERVALEGVALPILLPVRGIGSQAQSWFYDADVAPDRTLWHLEAVVRLQNRPWVQQIRAITSYAPLDAAPIPKSSIAKQLSEHPFLILDKSSSQLIIPAGQWLIETPLIVPPGYGLIIEQGARLKFGQSAIMLVHGSLQVAGSPESPVVFSAANGKQWPGLIVMNAEEESLVDYLFVSDTSGVVFKNWVLTGGINFYKSDVKISHSKLINSHGEDALNIIHSQFEITDLIIKGTASDAFDADFSAGSVISSQFLEVGKAGGGDAVDVSGSLISVADSRFVDVSDKALSIGEKSEMTASNIIIKNVGTGAASKDGSKLTLTDSTISGAGFAALTAYIKKPEYGAASIEAKNITISETENSFLVQTNSFVSVDGVEIETRDVNVDALYETIMQKGLR